MRKGKFIDLQIDFEKNNIKISATLQARQILKKCTQLFANGSKGLALTYSANYGQTRDIQRAYMSGAYCAEILGANQAQVVFEIESLLAGEFNRFQQIIKIAPITTMNAYSNPVSHWNTDVLIGIVQTDLDRIENYLLSGWDVLGWKNQITTKRDKHPYAIGGGVARLPQEIKSMIQNRLIEMKATYVR